MPELPEVERARRLAESAVLGRRIIQVAVRHDTIVFDGVRPRRFANAVRNRTIRRVRRRGKHLWFELDRRPWPLFHFGMTGGFHVYANRSERPRFWKVELCAEDGTRLAMTDMRRFGRIRLLDSPEEQPPIAALGFDPLLDLPGPAEFAARLTRRQAPVKAVLLDQGFAAGVGNWIADEVLFQARIAPHRKASALSPDEVQRLRARLASVIRKAVAVDADSHRFPRSWLFHHRWGRNADARTARGQRIVHVTVAGRTTAWVPSVQR
jgi:formamidopyrimidine-DNA glycosylase